MNDFATDLGEASMKSARLASRDRIRSVFILSCALGFTAADVAHAADRYWVGTSGSWATLTNWSTDPDNTTPNPGAIPGGSDDLFFNISTGNGSTIIDLGTSNRNAESLRINNTGTTGFRANASASATARTLTINPRGITMAPDAGTVTFGVDSATNGRVDLSLNALTNSITNNSSSTLNINNRVQSTAVGGATIINNGTGTGYVGMGDLRSTVAKIVQNSATSVLGLRQNSSTFTGTVEILKGTVLIGTHANNLGTSSGQVSLGSSAELATDAATLEINDSASITYTAKPIVLGTTSGLLKIVLRDDGGTRTHTITGAISGANNLTIENQANGLNADDNLVFSTGGLNNAGTITHIGDSAGNLVINSVIGPLVTGVIQNSATSPLVLSGANTYTGATTVNGGGTGFVRISADSGLGAAPGSPTASHLVLNAGGLNTAASFTLSANRGIELAGLGGLIFTDTATSLGYDGIMTGTNLEKNGNGLLTLGGANTYSGTTTVSLGGLLVNGTHSGLGLATVLSGARIGGTGSLAGGLTIASGGHFVFNPAEPTLDVAGTVTLDNSFGVASLVNSDGSAIAWSAVADGTYSLIGTTASSFANITNFGVGNAADIGEGRTAYFTDGSLNLTVVPEPGTGLAIATGLAAAVSWWRARRRPA